ncbi:type IV pili methyl-accepting chemotaxis transducer N-terminal domain-containing protein [Hydrogenophaga sp. PAMC20947]|uniref:type IV pili methyl-accepting chemotaxis transducer N-terminal domain-containing protein n=1 Tax=Hydrogenophaga sp. PAMC20947 TaxID=2565558 RepID=UPI00109DD85E|nr:type IV pili methyl-accepting chemotaxis transducer N-terminal domain-containing protein [Hydrogenophaga sp. PAMC20947]QCB47847.1 HAMP domain-containing protein [Hydrogenophaga sp. PAMC20947]
MSANVSLSNKLMRIGAGLLLLALTSIGLTLWVTWQLEGGAAAVNEAGRMRMQTWRLASAVQAQAPPDRIATLVAEFDQSLALLRRGDASRPLFVPWDEAARREFAAVQALWMAEREEWLQRGRLDPADSQRLAGDFVLATNRFVSTIEKQLSGYTAILNLFQMVMMALAVLGAVVMLYTGYMYVINPLGQLHRGLARLEAGDFGTRVEVDTNDEFGQVAGGFNRMAATLQSLYTGLESKVQSKTHRIEAQRARLEALYEVSAFLAKANSIEELSKGFSSRVRAVMKADAVAVRWSDEANQRYLMLATDAFPADMQEDERCLIAGACACGNLKFDARTRVIPIRSHEAAPMQHCAKAGYTSLVSVPVRLQARLIGEVDLFFREEVQLNADEVELLDALASHLASALEGLRAAALEREAAVGEERSLLARELHDSIAQSLAFLKIQAQLLRTAVNRDQPDKVQASLNELDEGLRESIGDVRELLVHFRTRTSAENIEEALNETLQKFKHQTGLATRLDVRGEGLPLPPDVQVQVLHVVQEALSNVRKHAKATRVTLSVEKGEAWRFAVEDDGAGFNSSVTLNETHVGRKIMHERAGRIGATVSLKTSPGHGTRLELTLPPHPVAGTAAPQPGALRPSNLTLVAHD